MTVVLVEQGDTPVNTHIDTISVQGEPLLGCHQANPDTILVHTYNALYVSDLSFLLLTCMTVETEMIEDGGQYDLYWVPGPCDLLGMCLA